MHSFVGVAGYRSIVPYDPHRHWAGNAPADRPHYVRVARSMADSRPGSPDWIRRGGWPFDRLERPATQSERERSLEDRLAEILHAEGCPNPLSAAARLIDGPLAALLHELGWRS